MSLNIELAWLAMIFCHFDSEECFRSFRLVFRKTGLKFLFLPLKLRMNFLFGVVAFFLFSFCFHKIIAQNQVPQLIIGKGRMIYRNKSLLVVIQMNPKIFQKIVPVSRKTAMKFLKLV